MCACEWAYKNKTFLWRLHQRICYTIRMPPENSFRPLRCLITLYYTYIYELQNIKSFFSVPLFLRFCVYNYCFTAALKSKPQNVCAVSKNNITFISFNVVKNACTRTHTLTHSHLRIRLVVNN